ncbi:MAG: hypothetical protein Rubg2KO_07580 [Rubricoccaceae bacterium]
MRFVFSAAILAGFLVLSSSVSPAEAAPPPDRQLEHLSRASELACVSPDPDPPVYYAIDLVTTKRVPGSRRAEGVADVTFTPSPFGIALSPTGEYAYTLSIAIDELAPARNGSYVVWVTTPNLDEVQRLGTLDDTHRIQGEVAWNKFLVVVSLEEDPDAVERWSGPIVLRGMSRSGMMHTMAGHGPFASEPCAVYGYQ